MFTDNASRFLAEIGMDRDRPSAESLRQEVSEPATGNLEVHGGHRRGENRIPEMMEGSRHAAPGRVRKQ